MNKQIEQMAKLLTRYEYSLCKRLPKDKCLLTSAVHAQVSCDYCKIAQYLYNAGYRKQSEGEWEPIMAIGNRVECSKCGEMGVTRWSYCPFCGAHMKGVDL